jgi:hypothetical protein
MLSVNFVARYFKLQDQMLNAAEIAGRNICKNTAEKKTRDCVVSKAIGVYGKDCSQVMVENAYAAGKQNLSF